MLSSRKVGIMIDLECDMRRIIKIAKIVNLKTIELLVGVRIVYSKNAVSVAEVVE